MGRGIRRGGKGGGDGNSSQLLSRRGEVATVDAIGTQEIGRKEAPICAATPYFRHHLDDQAGEGGGRRLESWSRVQAAGLESSRLSPAWPELGRDRRVRAPGSNGPARTTPCPAQRADQLARTWADVSGSASGVITEPSRRLNSDRRR